jgi:hypothetical protein
VIRCVAMQALIEGKEQAIGIVDAFSGGIGT